MEPTNGTTFSYFILIGVSDVPQLKLLIFVLVLLVYLLTLGGNLTILLLVCLEPQLYTPMYFFLGNLSFIDISSITTNLHKILTSFVSGDNTISFFGCMTQLYIFASLTIDELLILTAMSYDRYVAICNPLRYHVQMSHRVCLVLAAVCYLLSLTANMPYVVILSSSLCYESRIINHFFCDLIPLMKLSCDHQRLLQFYTLIEGGIIGCVVPGVLTIVPYAFIINTILHIHSRTGKQKAFYTCSSHLTVVVLLYVTLICQYLRPTSMDDLDSNKVFSLVNTVVVPILNPLIYSLKNQEVKSAFRRRLTWFTATS